ncbi:MAG: hypothetical protein OET79_09685, partial [Nitrospirota bacterium]|nr:hypothetical protein [Nitrospirota bacterium]
CLVPGVRPEDAALLAPWSRFWQAWVSVSFLKGYLSVQEIAMILPPSMDGIQLLLDGYILQKALYELSYELNNRPDWIQIPLEGIIQILESA